MLIKTLLRVFSGIYVILIDYYSILRVTFQYLKCLECSRESKQQK